MTTMTDEVRIARQMLEAAARTFNFLCQDKLPNIHWSTPGVKATKKRCYGGFLYYQVNGKPDIGETAYWYSQGIPGIHCHLPSWESIVAAIRKHPLPRLTEPQKALMKRLVASRMARALFKLELLSQ